MLTQLMNIEENTRVHLKTTIITWNEIMKKFIDLINLKSEPRLPNNQIMVGLKILRKMVEMIVPNQVYPAADWVLADYII